MQKKSKTTSQQLFTLVAGRLPDGNAIDFSVGEKELVLN